MFNALPLTLCEMSFFKTSRLQPQKNVLFQKRPLVVTNRAGWWSFLVIYHMNLAKIYHMNLAYIFERNKIPTCLNMGRETAETVQLLLVLCRTAWMSIALTLIMSCFIGRNFLAQHKRGLLYMNSTFELIVGF